MKCPVCGKNYSRLNSHILRTFDSKHILFYNNQFNIRFI